MFRLLSNVIVLVILVLQIKLSENAALTASCNKISKKNYIEFYVSTFFF